MEESVGPHVARGSRRNSTTGVGSEELFKNLKSDWQNLQGCLSTMPLRRGGADAPIKKMPRYLRSARRGRSYTLPVQYAQRSLNPRDTLRPSQYRKAFKQPEPDRLSC